MDNDNGDRKPGDGGPEEPRGPEGDEGAKIIDFETFRRRLEQEAAPLGLDLQISKYLREGIRQYLLEHVLEKGRSAGEVDLTFDADFLKKHGPGMLGSVLLSIANSLIPSSIDFNLPLFGKKVAPPSDQGTEGSRGEIGVFEGEPAGTTEDRIEAESAAGRQPQASGEAPGEAGESRDLVFPETAEGTAELDQDLVAIPGEGDGSAATGRPASQQKAEREVTQALEPEIKVNIDVDLLHLLRNLFRPRKET